MVSYRKIPLANVTHYTIDVDALFLTNKQILTQILLTRLNLLPLIFFSIRKNEIFFLKKDYLVKILNQSI